MELIKLDSGNLLNLETVAYVDAEKGQAYFKQPVIRRESDFIREKLFSIKATEADRDRIVEAMGAKHTPNRTVLGEVYGALEMVNQGMKDGAKYSDIDGLLHMFKMAVNGEDFND